MKVRALTGLQYPSTIDQRAKLRATPGSIPLEDRIWTYIEKDQVFTIPTDLIESLFERGIVEEVVDGS